MTRRMQISAWTECMRVEVSCHFFLLSAFYRTHVPPTPTPTPTPTPMRCGNAWILNFVWLQATDRDPIRVDPPPHKTGFAGGPDAMARQYQDRVLKMHIASFSRPMLDRQLISSFPSIAGLNRGSSAAVGATLFSSLRLASTHWDYSVHLLI